MVASHHQRAKTLENRNRPTVGAGFEGGNLGGREDSDAGSDNGLIVLQTKKAEDRSILRFALNLQLVMLLKLLKLVRRWLRLLEDHHRLISHQKRPSLEYPHRFDYREW